MCRAFKVRHILFYILVSIENYRTPINLNNAIGRLNDLIESATASGDMVANETERFSTYCIRPKGSDFLGFGVIAKFVIKNSSLI